MFGQIYDDELYHWKYIKKVKKNGKWRYYYDESANELTKLQGDIDTAQKALDDDFEKYYRNRYQEDMRRAFMEIKENPDGIRNVARWYNDPVTTEHSKQSYREGKYLRSDLFWAENAYRGHKSTIRGKIDAFMEKHGNTIAKNLNYEYVTKGAHYVGKKFP